MFSRFFSPIQHGVAAECGTELITHHIGLLLEHNPDWVVLKTDVKNAFNSISRQQIMEQVAKSFPGVYNHVVQMYEKVSPLVFMQGSTPVIIASAEGVHQGDPLGPILFASAIHSNLINLQEEHSKVCFLAYLDDVFIMGHPSDIQPAFQALKQKFSAIGLSIVDHKCEIYCPSSSASLEGFDNTSVSHDGIIIWAHPLAQNRMSSPLA